MDQTRRAWAQLVVMKFFSSLACIFFLTLSACSFTDVIATGKERPTPDATLSFPDAVTPEAATPDVRTPDVTLPEATVPEAALPDGDAGSPDGPRVCDEGARRRGDTLCGMNRRGRLEQLCTGGAWMDTTTCVDADVCVDATTRPGSTTCGFNARGKVEQRCSSGQWEDTTHCLDADICVDGAKRTGTTACGPNLRGRFEQRCSTGQWADIDTCEDAEVCVDATTRPGTTACGLNARGRFRQTCTTGHWVDSTTCEDVDVCIDAAQRPGTTACGFNSRGKVPQLCHVGQWQDTTGCNDPDECIDDANRAGSTACGLNLRGKLGQRCSSGRWVDTGTCADSDVCVDGAPRTGTTACGFNARGKVEQRCSSGQWEDTTHCQDADVCIDGAKRTGTTACGPNLRGRFEQRCSTGQWADTDTCEDAEVCVDGTTRAGATACGLNARGRFRQTCTTGHWADSTTCEDVDVCIDDAQRPGSTACGFNARGKVPQLCRVGQWQDTSGCNDPDECLDDAARTGSIACGLNLRGKLGQRCSSGHWVDTTTCQDSDVCVDDATQPGTTPCGLNARGRLAQVCKAGQWTDATTCADPDVCLDNASQAGTTPCGIRGGGRVDQRCDAGKWVDRESCADPNFLAVIVPTTGADDMIRMSPLPDGSFYLLANPFLQPSNRILEDRYLSHYDASGRELWRKHISLQADDGGFNAWVTGAPGDQSVRVAALANRTISFEGGLVATISNNETTLVVASYSSQAQAEWLHSEPCDAHLADFVDSEGAFTTFCWTHPYTYSITKLDRTGNEVFRRSMQYDLANNEIHREPTIRFNTDGSVVLAAGYSIPTRYVIDAGGGSTVERTAAFLVVRYGASGGVDWVYSDDSPGFSYPENQPLGDGGAIVVNRTYSYQAITTRIDPNGQPVWQKNMGDSAFALPNGRVASRFDVSKTPRSVTLRGGATQMLTSAPGQTTTYLASWGADGELDFVRPFESQPTPPIGNPYYWDTAYVAGDGAIYFTNQCQKTFYDDQGAAIVPTTDDWTCVVHVDPGGSVDWARSVWAGEQFGLASNYRPHLVLADGSLAMRTIQAGSSGLSVWDLRQHVQIGSSTVTGDAGIVQLARDGGLRGVYTFRSPGGYLGIGDPVGGPDATLFVPGFIRQGPLSIAGQGRTFASLPLSTGEAADLFVARFAP
jgi:hypothetical protein